MSFMECELQRQDLCNALSSKGRESGTAGLCRCPVRWHHQKTAGRHVGACTVGIHPSSAEEFVTLTKPTRQYRGGKLAEGQFLHV